MAIAEPDFRLGKITYLLWIKYSNHSINGYCGMKKGILRFLKL